MKQSELKTLTLIHSAEYSYTNIDVSGNVLFTGKNGTGKTTIMRSLLFFFIAKENKKEYGIINNKDFKNYYFPYDESYIIYSYTTEIAKNFVVVFKENNLLRFKFFAIDEYTKIDLKTIFIEDGQTLGYSEVFSNFRKHTIAESDIIKKNSTFIDVLCGQNNITKKSNLSIFALFKTKKDYHQIGKTVQNIFLNSKVESESIKNLLISSLDDSKFITLDIIEDSINRFNLKYENIKYFKENSLLVNRIANASTDYEELNYSLSEITAKIILRKDFIENKNIEIFQEIESKNKTLKEKQLKSQEIEDKFREEEEQLTQKIGVSKQKIKDCAKWEKKFIENGAKEKTLEYTELEILNTQKNDLESKYQIIVGDSKDKAKEFDNQKIEIENKTTKDINSENEKILKLKTSFMDEEKLENEKLQKSVEELNNELKLNLDTTNGFIKKLEELAKVQEFKKIEIENKTIENDELVNIETNIESLKENIEVLKNSNNSLQQEMIGFDKDIEFKNKELSHKLADEAHKYEASFLIIKNKITPLEQKVNFKKDSFISFLQENNHPNKNILFSIVKDEILISTTLNPVMKNENSNSLFGIDIDIEEIIDIDKLKLDLKTFKEELLNLESEYENLKKYIESENSKELKSIEKNRSRCRETIISNDKSISKLDGEINGFLNAKEVIIENLVQLKEKKLKEIRDKISEYIDRIEKGNLKVQEIEKKFKSDIDEQKVQNELAIKKLSQNYESNLGLILKQIEDIENYKRDSLELIEENKLTMLEENGVSKEKIKALSIEIEKLIKRIEKISSYKDIVDDYKSIKKNLLDNFEEYQRDKKIDDEKKSELTKNYKSDKKRWDDICKTYLDAILKLQKESENFKLDLEKYKSFESKNSELIQIVKLETKIFEKLQKNSTLFRDDSIVNFLINFSEIEKKIITLTKILSQDIKTFQDGINSKEAFSLYVNKNDSDSEILNVSKSFYDFIDKKIIDSIITESKKTFSMQINKVIQDINELEKDTSIIRENITNINSELKNLDDIEVIREFSMKADSSDNIVLVTLANLQNIYEKYEISSDDFGIGLFSFDEKDKGNKKADLEIFEALKELSNAIIDSNSSKIEIQDCFVLKFKVDENNNKGEWSETLDGVGSEGTDVIVKIMINVALLSLLKKKTIVNDVNLFCLIDEIGKLHPQYLAKLLKFANKKGIYFINGVPTDMLVGMYKSHYKLKKDTKGITSAVRVLYKNYKAE